MKSEEEIREIHTGLKRFCEMASVIQVITGNEIPAFHEIVSAESTLGWVLGLEDKPLGNRSTSFDEVLKRTAAAGNTAKNAVLSQKPQKEDNHGK